MADRPNDSFPFPNDGEGSEKMAQQQPVAVLSFESDATIENERKLKDELAAFIPILNSENESVAEEIRKEIKTILPDGLDVVVSGVRFSVGSIEIHGLTAFFDVLKDSNAVLTGYKYLRDAVKWAVEKVVSQRIGARYVVKRVSTRVRSHAVAKDPVHPLTRFFWWCSGSSSEILRKSKTESAKHVTIGAAVLSTGVLAFLSGGFAAYSMLQGGDMGTAAFAIVAPIWGLIIFNLDRSIVCTLKKAEPRSTWKERIIAALPVLPRVMLAAIIAVSISKPLEVAFFTPEIQQQLSIDSDLKMRTKGNALDQAFETRTKTIENAIANLNGQIAVKVSALEKIRAEFNVEMNGTGGSGKYGYNIVAKKLEEQLNRAQSDYDEAKKIATPKLAALQSQTSAIEQEKNAALKKFQEVPDGFLARINALAEIAVREAVVGNAQIVIFLLLAMVEMIPIATKVLAPYGPYDARLALENDAEITEAKLRRDAVVAVAAYHYESSVETERHVEDAFQEASRRARESAARAGWRAWLIEDAAGRAPSAEEFVDQQKKRIMVNRQAV